MRRIDEFSKLAAQVIMSEGIEVGFNSVVNQHDDHDLVQKFASAFDDAEFRGQMLGCVHMHKAAQMGYDPSEWIESWVSESQGSRHLDSVTRGLVKSARLDSPEVAMQSIIASGVSGR